MASIHPTALVASPRIGEGTRIWAYVNVLEGATIGRDCNICDRCFVENDVVIGDRVTVKCGGSLYDGLEIEDDVFVGPDVSFSNDSRPRSRGRPSRSRSRHTAGPDRRTLGDGRGRLPRHPRRPGPRVGLRQPGAPPGIPL